MSLWNPEDYIVGDISSGNFKLEDILKEYAGERERLESSETAGEKASSAAAKPVKSNEPSSENIKAVKQKTEIKPSAEKKEEMPAEKPQAEKKSKRSAMEDEAKGIFAKLSEEELAAFLAQEEASAVKDREPEIDPRFNIGGRNRRRSVVFNGSEVDVSSEPGYTPPQQGFAVPIANRENSADDYFVDEKPGLLNKFKSKKHFSGSFSEESPLPERKPKPETKDKKEKAEPIKAETPAVEEISPAKKETPVKISFADRSAGKRKKEEPSVRTAESREEADVEIAFRDCTSDDRYAEDLDFDEMESEEDEDGSFPGSFREYLASGFTAFLIRLRGGLGRGSTATVEQEQEELGPELSAKTASKYYGSFIRSQRLRLRIALCVFLVMLWISVGLPVTGMLKNTRVASMMLLVCQLNVMLLGLDVLTGAVMNLTRPKFGADALVLLSCLATCVDAVLVAKVPTVTVHLPLCVLSTLSLIGLMLASQLSTRAMRKAIRVPSIAKRIYTVTGETGLKGKGVTLLKSVRSYKGFVRRCEEAPPDETLFNKLSPFVALAALLFAVLVALIKKHGADFAYIFSAILAPAVPFSALLGFAMPYFIGSTRIFDSGAAIAGWSGLCDVGASRNLIVTDRDIFPEGSVELDSIRIFADESAEKVIAYAGTMLTAADSSIASCFGDIMERNGCIMRQVQEFETLPGGGLKGLIEGDEVLCGSTDLMRLMNVRIPHRLVGKTSVLLAINGVLYGIFNMSYTAQPQVRYALTSLMRSNRHPVFALRDFNVTPEMLRSTFDVATDGYDFPPYVERFAISDADPSESGKVAALVCREGLGPLTHMADTGRSMYLAVRINLLITVLSVVLALLMVFIKLLVSGSVGTGFLLVYMLAWAIPVVLVSIFFRS